ncbi:hypothetical protein ACLOJK_024266 [Asimina triloba]
MHPPGRADRVVLQKQQREEVAVPEQSAATSLPACSQHGLAGKQTQERKAWVFCVQAMRAVEVLNRSR